MDTAQIRIRVTPEEVETISQEALNSIDMLKKQFDYIGEIVERSSLYWEAEGQVAYINSYRLKCGSVEDSIKRFRMHIQKLQTIAGVYKAVEKEAAEIANSLESDVII